MARFLLDTNIISEMIKNPDSHVALRAKKLAGDICTSVIVAAELRFGCVKKGSPKLTRRVEDLLGELDIIAFDLPADAEYGRLRADLERVGQIIGSNDMLIAAHALALSAILVTANTREFSRIAGLRVENWMM